MIIQIIVFHVFDCLVSRFCEIVSNCLPAKWETSVIDFNYAGDKREVLEWTYVRLIC